jgi:hypothetical protein
LHVTTVVPLKHEETEGEEKYEGSNITFGWEKQKEFLLSRFPGSARSSFW